ncbi:uncharacterized protein GGS22DRAFT_195904 [Annulohypoxylon maeteangense]|uniref:uncharacterized protein n=1 Tax=Annulohypoxylon maeteangense TaxID=1927788 RepID=UPI002007AC67|nr:uncharacterized protein GGS22DRAFT_195904 [Annulohypoxylon maeteangense]KAI0882139.1 hypothetical protein GGS22DRAFT_195904 [Annulohypoxylon maeteangense]
MSTRINYRELLEPKMPPICSIKSIGKLPDDVVYIAINTRLVKPPAARLRVDKAHIAVLPRLRELPWTVWGRQSPQSFVQSHNVKVHRLERTDHSSSETYPGHLSTFRIGFKSAIEKIRKGYQRDIRIALVGEDNYFDFERIALEVEDIIECIDYRISLPKVIASSRQNKDLGLEDGTDMFSADDCVSSFEKEKYRDAAKAIWQLGKLDRLMHPRNVDVARLNVSTDVNERWGRPYRVAMIAAVDYQPLPKGWDSAKELAERVVKYKPIHVAASADKQPESIHTKGMTHACISFHGQEDFYEFLRTVYMTESDITVVSISPDAKIETIGKKLQLRDYW